MRDQNSTIVKAGATVAGTTYSTALDTRAPDGIGNLEGKVRLFLDVPIIPGLSDTKTVIFTLQDSADGSTFTDVPDFSSKTYTGASGAGAPAAVYEIPWLSKYRRYLRVKEVVASTPGTITAYNWSFGVVLGGTAGL